MIGFAMQTPRTAHHLDAAKLAKAEGGLAIPLARLIGEAVVHIAGNEQIQTAIAVVIAPGGARRPVAQPPPRLLGYVGKRPVMVVPVEAVLAVVGDIDVRPAIIVEIADDGAKAPAIVPDSSFRSDIRERAIVIVVEQSGVRRSLFPRHRIERRTVDEVDREPAVVVIIEQRYARTDCIQDEVLLRRPHMMRPFS